MIYKKIDSKNGIRYYRAGKLFSVNNIPMNILEILQTQSEYDDTPIPVKVKRTCIFCGTETNWGRMVNNEFIDLCKDHYYNVSLGKLAQKQRELQLEAS